MGWRDDIHKIAETVEEEYMRIGQAENIGEIWESLKPVNILEIGTYKGTGACFMGAMAKHYGGHVTTVDLPWTATHNKRLNVIAEDQLKRYNIDNVTVIRREDGAEGFIHDCLLNNHVPFDFIYLDGGHTWKTTAALSIMCWTVLRSGGWLCMDDVESTKWVDVRLVWERLIPQLNPNVGDRYEIYKQGFVFKP